MKSKELRNDLLVKTKKTKQWLSYNKKNLTKQLLITSVDALCILAHEEGLLLEKYLTSEELDRIRGIIKQIEGNQPNQVPEKVKNKKGEFPSVPRVIKIFGEQDFSDPILPASKLQESKEMASIYPLLYILENSIREFITISMEKNFGKDWWNLKATAGLKRTAETNMSIESKNSWHQRRGSSPIDYIDLNQLPALIGVLDNLVVPDLIPSREWFTSLVNEVYQSRCVLCHMNPLDKDSIQSVKLRFRQWERQLSAKKSILRNLG